MLIDLISGKTVNRILYAEKYRLYAKRLTPAELEAIEADLNARIEGTEIQTAGWMPGADWTGRPSSRSSRKRRVAARPRP